MNHCEVIGAVILSLNQVSVCGAQNMDRLLGCMQALTRVKNDMEREEAAKDGSGDDALQQRNPKDGPGAV